MDDVFNALVRQGGPFAEIVNKWRRKAAHSARKIAAVTHISSEDALQEVLLNMWSAYCTYIKVQARYEGAIWDVVGKRRLGKRCRMVQLQHPVSGERVEVPRSQVEPVDKRMSCASFVYLRMVQWQANLFTLHYMPKNGFVPDEKVCVNGKSRTSYVRVVFEDSLDRPENKGEGGLLLEDVLPSLVETPEAAVEFSDIIRQIWWRLDDTARLVLGIYVASGEIPLPECQLGQTDDEYVGFVLGVPVATVRAAVKKICLTLPPSVQNCEAMLFDKREARYVRNRPVQELLCGHA